MGLVLIGAAEVAFWVVLAAGLATRYLLRMRRLSTVLLLGVPLVDVALLVATVEDLRSGTEASFTHGLAALYLGFTVAYGHRVIRWADGYVAHRFGGAERPAGPPRYGAARSRYEWRLWRMTLVAAVITLVVIEGMVRLVDDAGAGGTGSLRGVQGTAVRAVVIHGIVALTYTLWPKQPEQPDRPPESGRPEAAREPRS
ncbi:hypothetical protein [Streptomyces sp. RFCAC02]|uniref:hypothetical protein n=1 Tax=Streptomyces sp. RFCAC02 TaxID=2499143 RepID=UPI0010223A12|nr:hypothetical protein [Streptomyces sp. RFCAC02]